MRTGEVMFIRFPFVQRFKTGGKMQIWTGALSNRKASDFEQRQYPKKIQPNVRFSAVERVHELFGFVYFQLCVWF